MQFGRSTYHESDEQLIELYQKTGDRELLGALFSRYGALVYGVCLKYLSNREDSQDAVLHIFERLLEQLKTEQINSFRGWLHAVTRNHCLMKLRKVNRTAGISVEEIDPAENQPIEDAHLKEAALHELEEALITLHENQQICIKLFYFENKRYQEISDITGFPLKKVKSYIQNGKRNLRISILQARQQKDQTA